MLFGIVLEPVLPTPAILIARRLSRMRIPVGAPPARGFAEAGPGGGEPLVQHAFLDAARRLPLPERPMVLVADTEGLPDPVAQKARIVLPGVGAADIDRPDIHRRMAMDDPVRHHESGATARQYSERVETSGDEKAAQIACFAHQVIVIG